MHFIYAEKKALFADDFPDKYLLSLFFERPNEFKNLYFSIVVDC
jgi:hypothetical protein